MPDPIPAILRRVPKAELHCHIVGAIRPATLVALARKHGLALPRAEDALYRYANFYEFIDTFRLASRALVEAADFERVTYEYIADAHRAANLRHVELFFDPSYHTPHGVRYRTQLDGLVAGLAAAERDFGVSGLLVPSIDREFGASVAEQVLDEVLAHRHERVVGLGMDGPEDKGPPEQFAAAYARAGRAGLRRTAHVCEDYAPIPAANYATCVDTLGCERLDHGYRLLTDPAILARARADGIPFTCCPKPSTRERDRTRLDAIRTMAAAGLAITLATDDPLMFETDLADSYARYFDGAVDLVALEKVAIASVDASWLDDDRKRTLRAEIAAAIATERNS